MAHFPTTGGRLAKAVPAAAAAALLTLCAAPAGAQTTIRPTAVTPGGCTSATDPALADRLAGDVAAALSGRQGTVALTLWDAGTGTSCAYRPSAHFDSASVVKATIMGAVLRRADEEGRPVTAWEEDNLRPMITKSDNAAATALWLDLGRPRLEAFLRLAGLTDTVLGADDHWGLTQVTAADELKVLDLYTDNPSVLSPESRAYGLDLMSQVVPEQRWGAPYGAPAGVTVHVKNGWLQRATHGWRVHSLGIFTGPGRNYRMAFLTHDNPTEAYGISTIQRVAQVVHRELDAAAGIPAAAVQPLPAGPDIGAPEISDGSAPYERTGPEPAPAPAGPLRPGRHGSGTQ
ncbi:serine hydrolase [Kitasatospora herbaricolor]|uniref:Class A beta-lactamase-related serine hydrolase n=1 Tax=Kitasatospora herbaricolor TaxID=68217 RepID=A0ABZ1WAT6_9ACTN|nr:serine hydrolase [Kitasatospora herbaricolor]